MPSVHQGADGVQLRSLSFCPMPAGAEVPWWLTCAAEHQLSPAQQVRPPGGPMAPAGGRGRCSGSYAEGSGSDPLVPCPEQSAISSLQQLRLGVEFCPSDRGAWCQKEIEVVGERHRRWHPAEVFLREPPFLEHRAAAGDRHPTKVVDVWRLAP